MDAKGDVFVVGGWCDTRSVAKGGESHNAPGIICRFYDGSKGEWGDWQFTEFSREWVGWQFGCWPVKATSAYTKVRVAAFYARNWYRSTFSNLFLHREQFGNTFVYDGKKNVVSAAARSGEQARMKYDDFDNLTSYVRPGAAETEKYVMTYGSDDAAKKKHLPITTTTPKGLKTTNTYDAKGNLTQTLNRQTSTDPAIGAKTGYDTKGNYATSATDARGKVVTKAVNETTGLTTSVTDPASTNAVKLVSDTKNRDAHKLGLQARREIIDSRGKFSSDFLENRVSKNLDAYGAFMRFGNQDENGAFMALYGMINRGEIEKSKNEMDANAIFEPLLKGKENIRNIRALRSYNAKDLVLRQIRN